MPCGLWGGLDATTHRGSGPTRTAQISTITGGNSMPTRRDRLKNTKWLCQSSEIQGHLRESTTSSEGLTSCMHPPQKQILPRNS
eukprot:4415596-Ditylum_brightwellii.AAC.1